MNDLAVASSAQTTPAADGPVTSNYPPPPGQTVPFYYPELDSIRFFLFCGVWAYHALPRDEGPYSVHHVPAALVPWITAVIRGCMCSLDVFFILSAFLITELLLRERESRGVVDLKAFYIRRLLRVWPLYFVVLALAGLLSVFDGSQIVGWDYTLAFLLFTGNWIMSLRGSPRAIIIAPLWSVCFEEQFYLLWPLVLRKASRKAIFLSAMALLPVAAVARLILTLEHQRAAAIWYNTFARLDAIAYGILLAVILHGRTLRLGRRARLTLLLLGISAWVAVGRSWPLVQGPQLTLVGSLIGYPLMSLGGVAIFLSVLEASQQGASFLRHSWLVYFGKISYGLYGYHYLGLRLSDYLLGDRPRPFGSALSLPCALVITFLLAIASFKWLESPFLRLKQTRFTYVPSSAPV
jgi:peptidoglycan/LPS O-acetylase OafA/YrhL